MTPSKTDLQYNYPSAPTRAHCHRCGKKFKTDYSGDIIHGDIWKEVEEEQKKRPAFRPIAHILSHLQTFL